MLSSALGSSALCGSIFGQSERDFSIVVDGSELSDRYRVGSLSIDDDLGQRRVMDLQLVDADLSLPIDTLAPRRRIIVTARGVRLFGGTIEARKIQSPGASGVRIYSLSAVDFNQLADRFHVTRIINDSNQTVGSVMRSIVENELADEGIGVDHVSDGPSIGAATYNFRRVDQIFDELSDFTGAAYVWFFDYYKNLHFTARESLASSFAITADNPDYRNFTSGSTRNQYRNVQVLRAGKDSTDSNQVQTFKGDGENQTFTLRFGVAEEPKIEVDTGAGFAVVDPENVGVNGLDEDREWYWSRGRNTVSQDTSATELESSHSLRVTYTGLFSQTVIQRDQTAINETQLLEGGSGVYEQVEVNSDIERIQFANERARGLLDRLAKVHDFVEYQTDRVAPRAGQMQRITVPDHGLDADYLILKVQMSDVGVLVQGDESRQLRYDVAAVDVTRTLSWAEFFRRLLSQDRHAGTEENQKVQSVSEFAETVSVGDSVSVDESDGISAFDVDPYSVWVVGTVKFGKAAIHAEPQKL